MSSHSLAIQPGRSDLPTKVTSGTSAFSEGTSEMSSMSSEMPRPSGVPKAVEKTGLEEII